MKSTMSVSQHKGVIGKTFSPQDHVRMDGKNRILSDIKEWAGVVGDAIRIATLDRQGRVNEAHGTGREGREWGGGRGGERRGGGRGGERRGEETLVFRSLFLDK